jgi:hypothetical protein
MERKPDATRVQNSISAEKKIPEGRIAIVHKTKTTRVKPARNGLPTNTHISSILAACAQSCHHPQQTTMPENSPTPSD